MKLSKTFAGLAAAGAMLVGVAAASAETGNLNDEVTVAQNGDVIEISAVHKACTKDGVIATLNGTVAITTRDADDITTSQISAIKKAYEKTLGVAYAKPFDGLMQSRTAAEQRSITQNPGSGEYTDEVSNFIGWMFAAGPAFQISVQDVLGSNYVNLQPKSGITVADAPSPLCK